MAPRGIRNNPLSRLKGAWVKRLSATSTQLWQEVFGECDSDGDGYSNLFERALGSDSLGPDRRQDLPLQPLRADNRQRISFVRWKADPITNSTFSNAGEIFEYHVEQRKHVPNV